MYPRGSRRKETGRRAGYRANGCFTSAVVLYKIHAAVERFDLADYEWRLDEVGHVLAVLATPVRTLCVEHTYYPT